MYYFNPVTKDLLHVDDKGSIILLKPALIKFDRLPDITMSDESVDEAVKILKTNKPGKSRGGGGESVTRKPRESTSGLSDDEKAAKKKEYMRNYFAKKRAEKNGEVYVSAPGEVIGREKLNEMNDETRKELGDIVSKYGQTLVRKVRSFRTSGFNINDIVEKTGEPFDVIEEIYIEE